MSHERSAERTTSIRKLGKRGDGDKLVRKWRDGLLGATEVLSTSMLSMLRGNSGKSRGSAIPATRQDHWRGGGGGVYGMRWMATMGGTAARAAERKALKSG
jgi:hypothetical protein